MGAGVSTVSNREVYDIVNSVIVNNLQTCGATNAVNEINVDGDGNVLSGIIQTALAGNCSQCAGQPGCCQAANCSFQATNQTQISNDITEKIEQSAGSGSGTVWSWLSSFGFNDNEAMNQAITNVTNQYVATNQQTCGGQTAQNKIFVHGNDNVITNTEQLATASEWMGCTYGANNIVDYANSITAITSQHAGDHDKGIGGWITMVLIVVVVALLVGVVVYFMAKTTQSNVKSAENVLTSPEGTKNIATLSKLAML
jgi:hypothetical protein